ncbi:MAG TPA: hypothetical protein VMR52_09945 [Dehalococcoidia bacterium]|nr:hypothetical protein [Dehalococcoidia bacterium]
MAGWKRTLDDAGWREANGVGVHFGIGRDGSVSQYVNLFDASHGHGVSGSVAKYYRSNRHLAAWERRPGARWVQVPYAGTTAYALIEPSSVDGRYTQSMPNCRAVSKEHEGFPFDAPLFDATWPAAMVQASHDVDEWIMGEFWRARRWEMAPDDDMKIGHFQIDGVHRVNCPGPEWPKAAMLAGLRRIGKEDITMGQFEELKEDIRRLSKLLESVSGLGVFVRAHGSATVYLLRIEDGELVKRSVSDPTTFAVMGGNFGAGGEFDNVREVDGRHLARVREAVAVRSVAS